MVSDTKAKQVARYIELHILDVLADVFPGVIDVWPKHNEEGAQFAYLDALEGESLRHKLNNLWTRYCGRKCMGRSSDMRSEHNFMIQFNDHIDGAPERIARHIVRYTAYLTPTQALCEKFLKLNHHVGLASEASRGQYLLRFRALSLAVQIEAISRFYGAPFMRMDITHYANTYTTVPSVPDAFCVFSVEEL